MPNRLPDLLPRTVDDIFADYYARRAALHGAFVDEPALVRHHFTTDEEDLALYSFPDGSWRVLSPPPTLPALLPEPLTGVSYKRGRDQFGIWLRNLALHSNLWLLTVAFFFAAKAVLGRQERMDLFQRINDMEPLQNYVDPDVESSSSSDDMSEEEGSLDSTAGS